MQATPTGVRGNGRQSDFGRNGRTSPAAASPCCGCCSACRCSTGAGSVFRRRLAIQRVGLPFQLLGMVQQRQAVGVEREHGRNLALVRRFGSQGRC